MHSSDRSWSKVAIALYKCSIWLCIRGDMALQRPLGERPINRPAAVKGVKGEYVLLPVRLG